MDLQYHNFLRESLQCRKQIDISVPVRYTGFGIQTFFVYVRCQVDPGSKWDDKNQEFFHVPVVQIDKIIKKKKFKQQEPLETMTDISVL